ncbi:hypothetical protein Tco_1251253 [Tanacetum coccineum]
MRCDGEIDEMLRIKLHEAGSNEGIFTSMVWIRAFNINELIYLELCHEFYSTYEFDEVYVDDELQTKKIIKFRLGGHAHSLTLLEFACRLGLYHAEELNEEGFNVYFQGGLCSDEHFNAQEYWKARVLSDVVLRSLSASIYCRDLDTTTLRELIDSEGRLILEDLQPGVPRVTIPRPPRTLMQDWYERMGSMEIRQGAIERMAYREPITHLDMLSYSMISIISSTHLSHRNISSSRMMMSSVEMTREEEKEKERREAEMT